MVTRRKVLGTWQHFAGSRYFVENEDGDHPSNGDATMTEVKCCGRWLRCDLFTNTCDTCDADYNMSGDRLAPRAQWGEETGEQYSDIVGGFLDD